MITNNPREIRIVHRNHQAATNPTRTELAALQAKRDQQRIEYFVRGISERFRPANAAEKALVREMAIATWKLKGIDMAERELYTEASRLLIPYKQEAYENYMRALRKLMSIRRNAPVKKAA